MNKQPSPGHIESTKELTLHTRQALKVFTGRKSDPENDVAEIKGMQIFTSLIKTIWLDAIDGNPYALYWLYKLEKTLKETEDDIATQKIQINEITNPYKGSIDISTSESTKPVTVTINYASPYSYKLVLLLINIDHLIAQMITLKHMGLLTPKKFEQIRKNIVGAFYRCMYAVTKYKSVKGLTNDDIKAGSAKFVEAKEAMGPLPELITSGSYTPELMPLTQKPKVMPFNKPKQSSKKDSEKVKEKKDATPDTKK